MKVRIGTSGWNYKHWRGVFYPEKLAQRKWLEFYTEHFNTVEVNSTFYRLPPPSTFKGWKERTPEDFQWAVKAWRRITHVQRLRDVDGLVREFMDSAKLLETRLGPVLFQLPPGLKFDIILMKDFLHLLRDIRLPVIEVRNRTWLNDDFYQLLKESNVALCISHSAGRFPFVTELTADFAYIRLHGPGKLYASSYSDRELEHWAIRIVEWNVPTYVYFNNDYGGYAVKNAFTLKKFIRDHSGTEP